MLFRTLKDSHSNAISDQPLARRAVPSVPKKKAGSAKWLMLLYGGVAQLVRAAES
jgi:hypothetical protein